MEDIHVKNSRLSKVLYSTPSVHRIILWLIQFFLCPTYSFNHHTSSLTVGLVKPMVRSFSCRTPNKSFYMEAVKSLSGTRVICWVSMKIVLVPKIRESFDLLFLDIKSLTMFAHSRLQNTRKESTTLAGGNRKEIEKYSSSFCLFYQCAPA
jgi:hypothetical protein